MKIRNFHQASIFMLSGANAINCGMFQGKYGKTAWIEFEEDENFKSLMTRWNNKEFV